MLHGALLTRFFLEVGICQTPDYCALTEAEVEAFGDFVAERWAALGRFQRPSEAETEAEFIFPVIARLGWEHLPQQEPGRGRSDVSDALLFHDAAAKDAARPRRG